MMSEPLLSTGERQVLEHRVSNRILWWTALLPSLGALGMAITEQPRGLTIAVAALSVPLLIVYWYSSRELSGNASELLLTNRRLWWRILGKETTVWLADVRGIALVTPRDDHDYLSLRLRSGQVVQFSGPGDLRLLYQSMSLLLEERSEARQARPTRAPARVRPTRSNRRSLRSSSFPGLPLGSDAEPVSSSTFS